MTRRVVLLGAVFAGLLLAASPAAPAAEPAGDDAAQDDPWEPMNRKVFGFNEKLDAWVLEPVATGWDFVMPDPVERSIQRFYRNLGSPVNFVNNLLQAKPEAAITDFGRFLVNSTVGIGGLFDPAGAWLRMPESDEDFGQTLGVWGVPPGPYLVLPFFGPSNPRDTGGMVFDYGLNGYTWFFPWYVNLGLTSVRIVNQRSRLLETIREERKDAFDFYVAVRNAYVQRRESQVADQEPKGEESDDGLYDLDPLDTSAP